MSLARSQIQTSPLMQEMARFIRRLEHSPRGRQLLAEMNQRIDFQLEDGISFSLDIREGDARILAATFEPRRFDDPESIHFRLRASTLQKLIGGEIRFTDALIPTAQDGADSILLLECTLFKWSVLSWIGRMIRTAQTTVS